MANNKRDDLYKNSVDYDYVKSMYVVLNGIYVTWNRLVLGI